MELENISNAVFSHGRTSVQVAAIIFASLDINLYFSS